MRCDALVAVEWWEGELRVAVRRVRHVVRVAMQQHTRVLARVLISRVCGPKHASRHCTCSGRLRSMFVDLHVHGREHTTRSRRAVHRNYMKISQGRGHEHEIRKETSAESTCRWREGVNNSKARAPAAWHVNYRADMGRTKEGRTMSGDGRSTAFSSARVPCCVRAQSGVRRCSDR